MVCHVFEVYLAHFYTSSVQVAILESLMRDYLNPKLSKYELAQIDPQSLIEFLLQHSREYQISKQKYFFGRSKPETRLQELDQESYVYTPATLRLLEQI